MKSIVIYSSLTGNTKQVAEAIASVLPEGTPCVAMSELPSDIASYDLVFAGFWVDKGTANKEARDVLGTLHNPHIALFATAGVPPHMEHAKQSLVNAADCLPEGVVPVDTFICQGKVDPKVIEMMYKMFPKGVMVNRPTVMHVINKRLFIQTRMTVRQPVNLLNMS